MTQYQLESAPTITGPFTPSALPVTPATDGVLNTVTPLKDRAVFFRLKAR